jgi:hypothetical protein
MAQATRAALGGCFKVAFIAFVAMVVLSSVTALVMRLF